MNLTRSFSANRKSKIENQKSQNALFQTISKVFKEKNVCRIRPRPAPTSSPEYRRSMCFNNHPRHPTNSATVKKSAITTPENPEISLYFTF
jgi:hypothetical protein